MEHAALKNEDDSNESADVFSIYRKIEYKNEISEEIKKCKK